MAGEIIENPKVAMCEPLPYILTEGYDHDRLESQYQGKGKIHNTWLKIFPSGKIEFGCDCYDFVNTKQGLEPCKHCENLRDNGRKHKNIEGNYYWKEING